MLGTCRMRAHAKRGPRAQVWVGLGWCIHRAFGAALGVMHRAHKAVDAAEEMWRECKRRVA